MKRVVPWIFASSVTALAASPALAADPDPAPKSDQTEEPATPVTHIEVLDGNGQAAVSISGFVPALQNVRYVRGRLEVALADGPRTIEALSVDDPLVKRVAIVGGTKPRLIIRLRAPDSATAELSLLSSVEVTDKGFKVNIPRRLPVVDPAPELAALDAAAPKPAEIADPAPIAPETDEASAPEEGEEASAPLALAPADDALAAPADAEASGGSESLAGTLATSPRPTGPLMWGFGGLALLGIGGLMLYRRKRGPVTAPSVHVVSSQSVGGKNRVVLLEASKRRFLVGVTDKGVTLIDRWESDELPTTAQGEDEVGSPAWLQSKWATVPDAGAYREGPTIAPEAEDDGADIDAALDGIIRLRRQREASSAYAVGAGR